MIGRKLPSTYARAIAFMQYNIVEGKQRKKLKRQARKEYRRYLKRFLGNETGDIRQ